MDKNIIKAIKNDLSGLASIVELAAAMKIGVRITVDRELKPGDTITMRFKNDKEIDKSADCYSDLWKIIRKAEGKTNRDGLRCINGHVYFFDDITSESISAVRPQNLISLTAEQNALITERCRQLLRKCAGELPGTERAMLMTDSLRIVCESKQIDPTKSPQVITMACPGGTIHLHNHPSGAAFSRQDIITFASCPKLHIMGVVGNSGCTYMLEKSERFNLKRLKRLIEYVPQDYELRRRLPYCGINYYVEGKLYDF